jgi:hypothetical protein
LRELTRVAVLLALVGARCETPEPGPGDPLAGDPIDPEDEQAASIVPGTPWIQEGPDETLGTADDVFVAGVRGDVDLVVRVGVDAIGSRFPATSVARGSVPTTFVEPFGRGLPIPFALAASDGLPDGSAGTPIAPDYMEGLPFLVLAFADLDGDGFVGVTHRDGQPGDAALESLELYPVGRRYTVARHTFAQGALSVAVGAPTGLALAIGAAAIAGPFENPNLPCAGCHSWPGSGAADILFLPLVDGAEVAPEGPIVMTALPFLPETEVDYRSAPRGLVPAHPDARVGVQVELGVLPDPGDPRIGEAFTLPLDGSSPSIDVARALSGPALRFGLTLPVDALAWQPTAGRSVRPGLGPDGQPVPVEVIDRIELSRLTAFRVVPLDALGNVAHPNGPTQVVLRVEGDLRLVSPDLDGNRLRETLLVQDARGAELQVKPVLSRAGALVIEGGGGVVRVDFGPVTDAPPLPSDVLLPPEGVGDGDPALADEDDDDD